MTETATIVYRISTKYGFMVQMIAFSDYMLNFYKENYPESDGWMYTEIEADYDNLPVIAEKVPEHWMDKTFYGLKRIWDEPNLGFHQRYMNWHGVIFDEVDPYVDPPAPTEING